MFTIRRTRPLRVLLLACAACSVVLTVGSSRAAGAADRAAAERLATADRQAIEATVRRQLEAFEHDDADAAFAIATADIQRMFGTSDQFLRVVRDHYAPVYRPANVRFVRIDAVDAQWVQTVQIVDGDGKVWRALFFMRRQPDRSWKVGGCQLVETSAVTT